MVRLNKEMRRRWREEIKREVGGYHDPFVRNINKYECHHCHKIKYYDGDGDPDAPQHITLRKMTKLGYGIGALVCHECWHEKGYKNPLVRRDSGCRICELAYWNRVAARRAKVAARLGKEKDTSEQPPNGITKQVSGGSEQMWIRSSPAVSKRRKHSKNVENRRSARRRAGAV